jgi:putative NADPH-quinone reductase
VLALGRLTVPRCILIIQGHPDSAGGHFGHALADAYAWGARAAGHVVRRLEVARVDFPLVRTQGQWSDQPPPEGVREAQAMITWADHLVIVFPLWLGGMPALLKGFFEQVFRPGFAFVNEGGRFPRRGLTGRTARVVVTMGMPAFWFRWYFRAHGVRSLERSILGFCGIKPVRETLIGLVETKSPAARKKWLKRMEVCGRVGD